MVQSVMKFNMGSSLAIPLAACLAVFPPTHAAPAFPSLRLEGNPEQELPHACEPRQLKQLKAEVLELSTGEAPALAWSLVHAMLCRKGPIARRLVLAHMPKMLLSISEGSGEEAITKLVPRSPEFMMNGNAWDVTARRERDTLSIEAFVDGACGADFGMQFLNGTWLIVVVGSACD